MGSQASSHTVKNLPYQDAYIITVLYGPAYDISFKNWSALV